jgi:hypothetical protein
MQELALATGKRVSEIEMPAFRPPTVPIKLGQLVGGEDNE